jgi:DNA polymerase III epsilon subunit-like protein
MNLLWIDTETGGLRPEGHSLLTLALTTETRLLDLAIKHSTYVVDAEALAINHIDLVKHHAVALEPPEVVAKLSAFLDQFNDEPVVLAGHNVAFDKAFLMAFLNLYAPDLKKRFSHRTLDTHSLALALRDSGLLPLDKLNSDALFSYFNIQIPENQRHTAVGDVIGTQKLYQCLIGLIK